MHGAKANAFERILGDGGLETYRWMCQGIERARAIAKICQSNGRGVGTGFLVRGRELYVALGDEILLLTNAHVLSDDAAHRAAVSPDDAQISFEALAEPGGSARWHRITEVVWKSGPEALEHAFCAWTCRRRMSSPVRSPITCPDPTRESARLRYWSPSWRRTKFFIARQSSH